MSNCGFMLTHFSSGRKWKLQIMCAQVIMHILYCLRTKHYSTVISIAVRVNNNCYCLYCKQQNVYRVFRLFATQRISQTLDHRLRHVCQFKSAYFPKALCVCYLTLSTRFSIVWGLLRYHVSFKGFPSNMYVCSKHLISSFL